MKAGTDLTEPALTDSTSRKRETRLSNQKNQNYRYIILLW